MTIDKDKFAELIDAAKEVGYESSMCHFLNDYGNYHEMIDVQTYLREEKEIYVDTLFADERYYRCYISEGYRSVSDEDFIGNTYESALLEGLLYACKSLKK